MREEVTEVLRQAILMAEIPAETYTRIVRDAIDAFESQLLGNEFVRPGLPAIPKENQETYSFIVVNQIES